MVVQPKHAGFTLNSCKDPEKRLARLLKGIKHIGEEIKILKDRCEIMEREADEAAKMMVKK